MRITYLHQYFNTPEMAGGTRSYEMARRLVAQGHEVNMITSWAEPDGRRDWFETHEAGIRVHWLPTPYSNHMGYWERILAFLRFAWAAARKAASIPTDVVFATSTPLTIALPGVYAQWRQKAPLVFEVRDLWPDVPYEMGAIRSKLLFRSARLLENFSYRRSARIVVLTPTMRDFLSGKGVPFEKIKVIPNLASLSDFDPAPNGKDGAKGTCFRLLYCGALGPAHDPRFLVDLASEFYTLKADILIDVLGDGRQRIDLERKADSSGCLSKTIRFHGKVPRQRIPDFYKKSDASIMTISNVPLLYHHSVQNKFFDSMAAGRPVFANYRGWASEVAEIAGAGWIVDRHDVTESASRIMEILSDQERLRRSQVAARTLAEKRFDANFLAKDMEAVLAASIQSTGKTD